MPLSCLLSLICPSKREIILTMYIENRHKGTIIDSTYEVVTWDSPISLKQELRRPPGGMKELNFYNTNMIIDRIVLVIGVKKRL